MLSGTKFNESTYIGEEFFNSNEKEDLHKCIVVEQAISEGYFSFEEALTAYEMDREEYEQYIAKKSNDLIIIGISGTPITLRAKAPQSAYFEIFAKMINNSVEGNIKLQRKLRRIERQLIGISEEIKHMSPNTEEKI